MEFEVDGKTYVAGKLNAMKQFHIMRKLLPIISEIKITLSDFDGNSIEDLLKEDVSKLAPLTDCIAKLSDEDAEYCIFGILDQVKVKMDKGLGYSPICHNNVLADSNMSMTSMMMIVLNALSHNFSDFLEHLPSESSEADAQTENK